jgi:hypothetical protein
VLGSRFPTLDGRSTVSVVGAEEVENEDGSDTNGGNNGATRLRGAVGSHANLLGDIYLRNICPVRQTIQQSGVTHKHTFTLIELFY